MVGTEPPDSSGFGRADSDPATGDHATASHRTRGSRWRRLTPLVSIGRIFTPIIAALAALKLFQRRVDLSEMTMLVSALDLSVGRGLPSRRRTHPQGRRDLRRDWRGWCRRTIRGRRRSDRHAFGDSRTPGNHPEHVMERDHTGRGHSPHGPRCPPEKSAGPGEPNTARHPYPWAIRLKGDKCDGTCSCWRWCSACSH